MKIFILYTGSGQLLKCFPYLSSSQSEKKGISKKSVILFAAQIAEGMMYLKSMVSLS